MAEIVCPQCGWVTEISLQSSRSYAPIVMEGILTCTDEECGARWPIKLVGNHVRYVDETMPSRGASKLNSTVPLGLYQDIEEADRAFFASAYKAVVVLCRRSIQLALEDKGATGRTLGPVLESARSKKQPLLSKRADALAEGVKDFGDGGAHRREEISREDAFSAVNAAVTALNELFPPPSPRFPMLRSCRGSLQSNQGQVAVRRHLGTPTHRDAVEGAPARHWGEGALRGMMHLPGANRPAW